MGRVSVTLVAGIVSGVVLLGSGAQADTTTSVSTTSTTTTTLLPHPFSAATRACIHTTRVDARLCRHKGNTTCDSTFQTSYASCFAAGAGVKCATKCESKQTTCLAAAPTTQKKCATGCVSSRRTSRGLCRSLNSDDFVWAGQETSCISDAEASYGLCVFTCAEAKLDCFNAFKLCIANCPNL